MKTPVLRLTSQIYAGRRVVEVRNRQERAPTYDEAISAFELAEERGLRSKKPQLVGKLRWFYKKNGLRGFTVVVTRCECGELTVNGYDSCRTCKLLADLVGVTDLSGPIQVRFERAERAQSRLADLVVRLQLEAKGLAA